MRVISPGIKTTAGDVLVDMLGKTATSAEIVWVNANADTHWQTNWLLRLNEQRQRLIASERIFILVLPVHAQSQAAQIAPDLWAIRSLVYRTKAKQTPLSQAALEWLQPVSSRLKDDAIEPNKTPSAVKAWQTMYSHWLAGTDEKKQLSITIGLRATEQRKQQRDFDGALRIAQQTLEVAEHQYRDTQAPRQKKHLLNLDRAHALTSLGDLQSRLGQTLTAQDLYERAISLFEKEQYDFGRANALRSLGDLQKLLGKTQAAQALYERAISLYEKEQDDIGHAHALTSLGDLQHRFGQMQAAKVLYERAISLYEKEQDDLGHANALTSLGDLQTRLGQVQAAQALYERAISLYEKEQHDLGRANALRSLGDLQHRLGQTQAAQALYERAISLYEKEQDDLGLANALNSLGDLQTR